jgi:hypothetical protein
MFYELLPIFCRSIFLLHRLEIIFKTKKFHTEAVVKDLNAFQLLSGSFSNSFLITFLKYSSLKEVIVEIYSNMAEIFFMSKISFSFSGLCICEDPEGGILTFLIPEKAS